MAVVGRDEGVEAVVAVLERPQPLVEPQRRAARLVHEPRPGEARTSTGRPRSPQGGPTLGSACARRATLDVAAEQTDHAVQHLVGERLAPVSRPGTALPRTRALGVAGAAPRPSRARRRSPRRPARRRSGWARSPPSPSAVLFSKVLVTVTMPGRGHLERHQARMRRVHQREPDVVLAQQRARSRPAARAGAAPSARRRRGRAAGPRAREPMPCSSQPLERAALERPAQRQHAELEHVARRVRLGPGVEQQPPRRRPASSAAAGGSIAVIALSNDVEAASPAVRRA